VEATQQRGLNIAYGILNNSPDAEEVLQEAYLQVYRNINQLKSPLAFHSWFGKIVTHLAFRKLREQGKFKAVPLDEVDYIASDDPDPEVMALAKLEQRDLQELLRKLPDEYRAAIVLREWEGYSYQEISEILEIPLGTVKSRIFSARRILLAKLKGNQQGGQTDE
jgi:RNA polymerase sigma-70 factor (ECF subfamily)